MQIVEKEVKDKVLSGENFVTKFVDIGTGSGKLGDGVLQAEKSDKFIQAMSEATTFLDRTKIIVSSNHKRELDTMSFELELEAGRVSGTPATLSTSQDPTFANRTFSAEELRALTGIHKTALKENIEGKNFMNTLNKVVDGILAKATADSAVTDDLEIDLTETDILAEVRTVIDAFPDKYKVPGQVVMYVPAAVNRAVRRQLTDNQDKYGGLYEITATGDIVFEDVTFITIPAFSVPKNTFSDKPFIIATKENIQWLADPDNIEVEAQFVLRSNAWDIASTIYADINYAFSDAIAIGTVKEA